MPVNKRVNRYMFSLLEEPDAIRDRRKPTEANIHMQDNHKLK